MVEKLKSILKRTRWSLLLKAVIFGAAWLVSPFWLFVLIALYLCFVPIPQSRTIAGLFFILLIISFIEPKSGLFALIFGIIFFYMLLIKELVLIDRASAYEIVLLLLAFFLLRDFYLKEGGSINVFSFIFSFLVAGGIGFLLADYIRFAGSTVRNIRRPAILLSTLLTWQLIIAGLFLPLDFVYQAVIVFLGIIPIVDLVPQYLFGEFNREKALIAASVVLTLFVIVLGSARWGL